MKQASFQIILLFFSLFLFTCERDDICAESTPTTPHLVIRFYDIADNDQTKTVTGLLAYALDDNDNIIPILNESVLNRDSIAIPLRTDMNMSRFVLHKDYDIDDNGTPQDESDDIVMGNPELINLNYIREDVYVSRACGFKTVFNTFSFSVEQDTDNWIINSEIVIPDITDENQAHVKVYH